MSKELSDNESISRSDIDSLSDQIVYLRKPWPSIFVKTKYKVYPMSGEKYADAFDKLSSWYCCLGETDIDRNGFVFKLCKKNRRFIRFTPYAALQKLREILFLAGITTINEDTSYDMDSFRLGGLKHRFFFAKDICNRQLVYSWASVAKDEKPFELIIYLDNEIRLERQRLGLSEDDDPTCHEVHNDDTEYVEKVYNLRGEMKTLEREFRQAKNHTHAVREYYRDALQKIQAEYNSLYEKCQRDNPAFTRGRLDFSKIIQNECKYEQKLTCTASRRNVELSAQKVKEQFDKIQAYNDVLREEKQIYEGRILAVGKYYREELLNISDQNAELRVLCLRNDAKFKLEPIDVLRVFLNEPTLAYR